MDTPEKISFAAQRLKEGHRVNRITVRDFLRHFGTERRGSVKVQEIRTILDSLDLDTEPNFETAWIDSPIWLTLKDETHIRTRGTEYPAMDTITPSDDVFVVLESTPSSVEHAVEQTEQAPTSNGPETGAESKDSDSATEDPTFRIGRLPEANKKIVVVHEHDTVSTAIALMLQYEFSQLPVMHGDREVKGIVTWKTIGSRLAWGCTCKTVGDCREEARIIDSNRTLFDAIAMIVEDGYVLVRDQQDKKITGIVTASDLSLGFQALSEPFLLLREIELHVRQLLAEKLSEGDLELLAAPTPPARKRETFADLTFGEYVRLIQNPSIWCKLDLGIDRSVLVNLLDEIRLIRNDVMHFDPDPMTPEELRRLKQAAQFMRKIYELRP